MADSKTPTRPKRAAKKRKPAGGCIGQAERLADRNDGKTVAEFDPRNHLNDTTIACIRSVVREELATLKKRAETANRNSRPSEPTEGEVEAMAEALWDSEQVRTKDDPATRTAWAYYVRRQNVGIVCPPIIDQYRSLATAAYAHLRSKP